jgi:hypothetical protein
MEHLISYRNENFLYHFVRFLIGFALAYRVRKAIDCM